eukprot:gb/GFBE01039871.1/.p1 GENE.gb/GFBE01039871.1/~~gb/GFBE01039871.1/.p1  ORF type:complete len:177 (+),score=34.49 gb/GFBE01039871.1/:1-531(+)
MERRLGRLPRFLRCCTLLALLNHLRPAFLAQGQARRLSHSGVHLVGSVAGLVPLAAEAGLFPMPSEEQLAIDPRTPLTPPPPWAVLPPLVQIAIPLVIIFVLGAVVPTFFGLGFFGQPPDDKRSLMQFLEDASNGAGDDVQPQPGKEDKSFAEPKAKPGKPSALKQGETDWNEIGQ